jgi:hypothetical protein
LWKHPLGEVHGGTDATTGARVLVTALHAGAMIHDRILEAAQQVAREAAALDSPFIAKPVDVQRLSDGRVGVACEALEGTPLTNVSRNQALPASRVYAMLRQLCRALSVAHAKGVVHRGISMGSVLLRARTDRPDSIVLTDFALGALLDADLVVQKEDAALQPVTPERISGQDRDAREDTYLLGCLAYTLLTGGAPFRTGTPDAVRRRHAIEDPMPITDRLRNARSVPLALATWVHRCLAKEPDDRYENVAELEAALCFSQMEDRVQTPWDDLPPPDVDPNRRGRIIEGLQHGKAGGARPTIDDQITTLRSPEFGDEDDDGDKTIVRAVQLPTDAATAGVVPTPTVDERSRSIVLEQDAARMRGKEPTAPVRERQHADTVDVPAPRRHDDTVDAPPPVNDDTLALVVGQDETHVGPVGGGRHEETVVGIRHEETYVGPADRDTPLDRRDTLIAGAEDHDAESHADRHDDVHDDTFAGERASDATFGGPPPEGGDITIAGPPMPPARPSEQETIRGPAPTAPSEPLQLEAVNPPLPSASAVPGVISDEEDSLGDLQTRITQLPPVRDGNTVVAPAPAPPVVARSADMFPPSSVSTVLPPPSDETPTQPWSEDDEPIAPAPPPPSMEPTPAAPMPLPEPTPAPPMPVVAQPPVAAQAPAPNAAWGLPPPTLDVASLPGSVPSAWGSAPVDAEMSMMGSTDFGQTRRLVGFLIVAAIGAVIVVAVMLNNRPTPPPPAPVEPPGPVVTVKPTTPIRVRDPAFDTAKTAAEFAVAGDTALAQKRLEDAEELFQMAIVHDARHVGALLGLGQMRGDANDWTKAAAYYQRAVNAAPKDGTARIALGDAYVKLGKTKDARREYKKAKQLGHPDAAAKLASL